MNDTSLGILVGGSAFMADFGNLQSWRSLLDCADAIALVRGGRERVSVRLGGPRRWIAFQDDGLSCIGYQETVGAVQEGNLYIGGSNRKVLCWLDKAGVVRVGNDV